MRNNPDIKLQILKILRIFYNQNVDRYVTVPEISDQLGNGISFYDIVDHLVELTKDSLILLEVDGKGHYHARLTYKSLEELDKSEMNNEPQEVLDLPVLKEDFQNAIRVFISHKFVKDDQKLAFNLQKLLLDNHINGYMAERKREYELLIGDKIKKEIEHSDYLVAILTKSSIKSPSVNEEIGYALGKNVPVLILLEKNVDQGVLSHGREPEYFTHSNFEQPFRHIMDHIVKHGAREKITEKVRRELIQNIYSPCYDMMKNIYNDRHYIQNVPPNPWRDLTNTLKLKTEPEIKKLFEEYSKELGIWQTLFVERENDSSHQKQELIKILIPPFDKAGLLLVNGNIQVGKAVTSFEGWFENFRFALFDPSIQDATTLYEKLLDYAINKIHWYEKTLKEWYAKTDLFRDMVKVLPHLRNSLNTAISYEQLASQQQILVSTIEKLTIALEEKVKESV